MDVHSKRNLMKFEGLEGKVRECFKNGYSSTQVKALYALQFCQQYPTLTKKDFNDIVEKIAKTSFSIKKEINGKDLTFKFIINPSNEYHIPIVSELAKNFFFICRSFCDEAKTFEITKGYYKDIVEVCEDSLLTSFSQTRETLEDGTISYIWKAEFTSEQAVRETLLKLTQHFKKRGINVTA